MNLHKSQLLTLLIFVAITVVGSIAWVVALMLTWLVLDWMGAPPNMWAFVEAISTAVTAAAVFSAGFVAYRELSEISDSRYMEVADKLFNELNAEQAIVARRWVYQQLPEEPSTGMEDLSEEGQNAVKHVLNSLDRVAFLTQSGWIPDDLIMPWMHPMIAKTWAKVGPYVLYERERRNEPYYYEYAEKLAQRTLKWRETHDIHEQTHWVDRAL